MEYNPAVTIGHYDIHIGWFSIRFVQGFCDSLRDVFHVVFRVVFRVKI